LTTLEAIDEALYECNPEDPVARLRAEFPWPDERPEPGSVENPGWLGEGSEKVLAGAVLPETRVVVELGAWLGMSTRYLLELAPDATVISVDHWQGSPEHQSRPEYQAMLPKLYDTFLSLCWDDRERIVPLRMSTLDGLRKVAECGIEPDIIYLDAEHSYAAVTAELELARELFPHAKLLGDDYDWQGVREAVVAFARRQALVVERVGARGWKLVERSAYASNGHVSSIRARSVVLVPHLSGVEAPCERGLRDLELAGVRVLRRQGSSQIDLARSEMASDALHDGHEAILFIDADIGFDAADALRLLERPEPVVSGVYAKKGPRELASTFAEGTKNIMFGPDAPGLYPLRYAATGFLRIRAEALRRMIELLKLPLCNTQWGRGVWPFFLPFILPQEGGKFHYLGEDWSFSHRLLQIGITAMADTTIRLDHYGPYAFSWEDVGAEKQRFRTYNLSLS
jgi:hypothetical protein